MQEEPFDMETEEGNGETQQTPFSLDAEWKESDHPRKENGQFGKGGGSSNNSDKNKKQENQQKEENQHQTSQEEKQKKIDSVNIDPNKDNVLPELNKEEQAFLGVGDYPVRLKQKIYSINQKHNNVNKGDDNYIIGSALYDPENVIPAKTPGYYHFIKRVYNDRNSFVLLDVNVNKNEGYLDIVHYYYTDDENRKRTEKNH